jgi:probable sporulation protein (polysaccharide deacetylase family)
MRVFFVNQRRLRVAVGIFLGFLISAGFVLNREKMVRQIIGAKPGVSLEDRDVTGMLPAELKTLVSALAEKIERRPVNAGYFPETGEILPSRSGKKVKVAETVRRICLAKAGTRINLAVVQIAPKVTEEFFTPVYHGNKERSRVALTFNVAWGEEFLPDILRVLKEEDTKATFFFVGTWAKAFPELVKEIAAQGHEVANHGFYHSHPLQMKREDLKRLIVENAKLLESITEKNGVKFFAPPYGEVNAEITSIAGELGYRTILWSVDSIDWKNPTPDLLLQRVLTKIAPGGIILMHPTQASRKALRPLIRTLKKRGLEPGTVSSVLDND